MFKRLKAIIKKANMSPAEKFLSEATSLSDLENRQQAILRGAKYYGQ